MEHIKELINTLACPNCNTIYCQIFQESHDYQEMPHFKLDYSAESQELICHNCQLAFPIVDNIPIMLIEEAKKFS